MDAEFGLSSGATLKGELEDRRLLNVSPTPLICRARPVSWCSWLCGLRAMDALVALFAWPVVTLAAYLRFLLGACFCVVPLASHGTNFVVLFVIQVLNLSPFTAPFTKVKTQSCYRKKSRSNA